MEEMVISYLRLTMMSDSQSWLACLYKRPLNLPLICYQILGTQYQIRYLAKTSRYISKVNIHYLEVSEEYAWVIDTGLNYLELSIYQR